MTDLEKERRYKETHRNSNKKYQQSKAYKEYKSKYIKKRYVETKKKIILGLLPEDCEHRDEILKAETLLELNEIVKKINV